jgi:hypothetical protein
MFDKLELGWDPREVSHLDSVGATPRVLRGAVRSWPAVERWSRGYLVDHAPDWPVLAAALDGARVARDSRGLALRSCRLADAGDDEYIMAPLDGAPAIVRADIRAPEPFQRASWRSSKLWLSPASAESPLHFDLAHNFHAVVSGRKKFLVFLRRDSRNLYPDWTGVPNFSRVDPERVDRSRFPRFARSQPFTYTLEAGDAIVLPGGVWHHVTTCAPTISLNFWWASGLHGVACRLADRAKRLVGKSR